MFLIVLSSRLAAFPRTCKGSQLPNTCHILRLVRRELSKLKPGKATGLDGIPPRLLKDAGPEIARPIAYLINLTISKGEIPSGWKAARVTPIFKSGTKSDENNYRPISVLPLLSKIMERAVQVQLLTFLKENRVLSPHQIGFQKTALYRNSSCIPNWSNTRAHGQSEDVWVCIYRPKEGLRPCRSWMSTS